MKIVINCCFLLICAMVWGQTPVTLEQANALYQSKNYQQAAEEYEQLAAQKPSKEVYFNLGNSYYQLQKVGPAIYAYEKALQIDPTFLEAQENLKFAEQLKVENVTYQKKISKREMLHQTIGFLTPDQWGYLTIAGVALATLSFAVYYFSAASGIKKTFFSVLLLALIGVALSMTAGFAEKSYSDKQRYAIVIRPETNIKAEPRPTAKNVKICAEGTKLFVLESTSKWLKVELPDLSSGWVSQENAKEL